MWTKQGGGGVSERGARRRKGKDAQIVERLPLAAERAVEHEHLGRLQVVRVDVRVDGLERPARERLRREVVLGLGQDQGEVVRHLRAGRGEDQPDVKPPTGRDGRRRTFLNMARNRKTAPCSEP